MKSKHDVNVKNGTYSKFNPFDVVIIGLDTDDGPEHSLCDTISNNTPITEVGVKYAMEHGIDDPCIGIRDGDKVLIWRGRKKTRECREACTRLEAEGRAPILLPVIIKRGTHDAAGVRSQRIMENWLRRDLSILDKAREANELIERGEATREEVAERLNVKLPRLKEILDLINLSKASMDAVESGRISPSAAAPLTRLSVEDQRTALIKILAESGTKKPTTNRVREATGKAPVQTPKVRLARASDALQAIAGDLTSVLSDDSPLWASLSALADAVCGKSWQELTSPQSADDIEPFVL